jgi:hypothetical protein
MKLILKELIFLKFILTLSDIIEYKIKKSIKINK